MSVTGIGRPSQLARTAGVAGPVLNSFKGLAPQVFDHTASLVIGLQQRSEPPRRPEGTLHASIDAGAARGRHPGLVLPVSGYTEARTHPLTAAAMLTAGVVARGVLKRLRPL